MISAGHPQLRTQVSPANNTWLSKLVKEAVQDPPDLHLVLQECQHLIEANQRIYMLFQSMLHQAHNRTPGYEIEDYPIMPRVPTHIITHAPP
ncbi:hypothetical protein ETB97_009346 [Aspergillus alliaceus]|uniref:L-tryptophan decarboxylase PsiD-like domain-containing protein n=1 Tax=Petromyces alliaceus TaxID=209559 RepID=A0A8H5ZS44_PETAA|nr:hypothetical protein ETB97_009346 [Aspergillus burnettii]